MCLLGFNRGGRAVTNRRVGCSGGGLVSGQIGGVAATACTQDKKDDNEKPLHCRPPRSNRTSMYRTYSAISCPLRMATSWKRLDD